MLILSKFRTSNEAHTYLVAYVFHGIVDSCGLCIKTNDFTVSASTTGRVNVNVAWLR